MTKRKAGEQLGRGKKKELDAEAEARRAEEPDSGDGDSDDEQEAVSDGSDEGGSEGEDESGSEGEDESSSDDDDSDDESAPEESSDEPESDDDEDGEAYKEVNVDFEFFDPAERDFLGLKALLNTWLDGQQYDCSGLIDDIIKQTAVGTVVKSSEDDDPFALLTAFNAARVRGQEWARQLRAYLAARCPDEATKRKLEEALESPATGLLVSERLINCPPQLAPPLLQFLLEEIEGAATDEDYPKSEREEFAFKRYLHFTRVYSDPQDGDQEGEEEEEGDDEDGGGKAKGGAGPSAPEVAKAKAPQQQQPQQPVIVYVRPEDEYLHQVCSWSFTFPIEGRPVAKGDLRPLRCVMGVEARRMAEARAMLDHMVGNVMAEGPAAAGKAAAGKAGPAGAPQGGKDSKGKAAAGGSGGGKEQGGKKGGKGKA